MTEYAAGLAGAAWCQRHFLGQRGTRSASASHCIQLRNTYCEIRPTFYAHPRWQADRRTLFGSQMGFGFNLTVVTPDETRRAWRTTLPKCPVRSKNAQTVSPSQLCWYLRMGVECPGLGCAR